jgi:hypothetical protein
MPVATATRKRDFSPFSFQAPLAAGGLTLMAYNWLQFTVPHGEGALALVDIQWTGITAVQTGLYGVLIGIMLALTLVNLLLTGVFSFDLVRWLAGRRGYQEFMSGPTTRITGIFVPIASLAMTMAVVFATAPFFIPALSTNLQALMAPGLVVFGALWLTSFATEARMFKTWLDRPVDTSTLNFVWLLDVFAFGLVALAGTGLAAAASGQAIASTAALMSLVAVGFGTLLLAGKLILLLYVQLKAHSLPEHQLQPAFFLLVPITCLYGISYYKIMVYLQKWFEIDVTVPSYFLITPLYGVAMAWAAFTVYLLGDYFKNYFRSSEYFPTQWAMV